MTAHLFDRNGALICANPECEGEYLHHSGVSVYRREEDAETGLHVFVDYEGESMIVDSNMSGLPPTRRDGVCIDFWCEDCSEKTRLYIYQNKGCTYTQRHLIETSDKIIKINDHI